MANKGAYTIKEYVNHYVPHQGVARRDKKCKYIHRVLVLREYILPFNII